MIENLDTVSTKYHARLEKVVKIWAEVEDIHPCFARLYPIVLAENGQFYLFDVPQSQKSYDPIRQVPAPMAIPAGVRASFPLDFYQNQPACIVTGDGFDNLAGYATIFHEFVHCYQWLSCEQALKIDLRVAQEAQARNDFMWEMSHGFPYNDDEFTRSYEQFLSALDSQPIEGGRIASCRNFLKRYLSEQDYEYMVWQEWKEGFARYIENLVRCRLGVEENHGGQQRPFDRVVFYEGGARYTGYLAGCHPGLPIELDRLFHNMMEGYRL